MLFADHAPAQRMEAAEGDACAQFARARKRLFSHCDSATMKCAGADVVFDGIDAPTTQTFGIGMFQPLTSSDLDQIEHFSWISAPGLSGDWARKDPCEPLPESGH